ncbi:MAG: DNA alkylation repair protein [Planctomycetota bacterium]
MPSTSKKPIWTTSSLLKELESLGTEQNRKVYGRHGVTGPQFGVSFAHLGKLRRQIKVDQELAEGLWASGNHDARVLAAMIADPGEMKASTLDTWVKDVGNHVIANTVAELAARHASAKQRAEKWTRSRSETIASAGWNLVSDLAKQKDDDAVLSDDDLRSYVEQIEKGIHTAPNRTRYSMNSALISIGSHRPKLKKEALAIAKRIGPVEIDHGETGCKTPDAAERIQAGLTAYGRKAR